MLWLILCYESCQTLNYRIAAKGAGRSLWTFGEEGPLAIAISKDAAWKDVYQTNLYDKTSRVSETE